MARAVCSWGRVRVLGLLVGVAACGDHGPTTNDDGSNPFGITATGPGVLSVSPLDTATIYAASPLGKLAPPGHTLPTDHVYLNFVDAWSGNVQAADCSKRPVYAAGSGVVDFMLVTEAAGDTKVGVQMTKTFHYYYDHVLVADGSRWVPRSKPASGSPRPPAAARRSISASSTTT